MILNSVFSSRTSTCWDLKPYLWVIIDRYWRLLEFTGYWCTFFDWCSSLTRLP